ncbi:Protein NPG1 [Camellia lanceoleosa]|uniref:Protein NPG1 n=1 Tax=Camellia lanceoleosa TaxID=1840588 RepID=A0ACC0IC54_9ERIC|nr:Protein NPG1 [Camellia lanceoleosa]
MLLACFAKAAHECKSVLDAVEKIIYHGILDVLVDNKLQETVSHTVELLPELWKQAGCDHEAMSAYRRALLSQWNLENDCYARIQKGFAVFLLYGGVEAGPPRLAVQIDGSYVLRNNLEEAILLLIILMRKSYLGKIECDPSVVEHLTFALPLCSQTSVLVEQLEKAMPGVFHRVGHWIVMAFCYSGAGLNKVALNLLRKSLHNHEKPDDLTCLLLAAKIYSEDTLLAVECMGYAQRAIVNAVGVNGHLKGVVLLILGLCLGKKSKVSSSDFERSHLQFEALKSLDGVIDLECNNSDLIFELGVHYAENQNLSAALHYSKQFIDATGGSILKDETSKWEQGPLLRMKAKLKIAQSLPMDAIETYRYLLALVQA